MSYFETERVCIDCGATFKPYQYNQKRCPDCVVKKNPSKYKGQMVGVCKGCGKEFIKTAPQQYYCSHQCKAENSLLLHNYGITRKDWNTLYEKQGGTCAICHGKGFVMKESQYTDYSLVVDHDHRTGEIRGLLCHNCNRALGLLQDDPGVLNQAQIYLKESATTMVKTSTPKQVEAQSKGRKNMLILNDIVSSSQQCEAVDNPTGTELASRIED